MTIAQKEQKQEWGHNKMVIYIDKEETIRIQEIDEEHNDLRIGVYVSDKLMKIFEQTELTNAVSFAEELYNKEKLQEKK